MGLNDLKLTSTGKVALFLMKSSLWKYTWYKKFIVTLFFGKEKGGQTDG